MNTLAAWALQWHVGPAALADLAARLGALDRVAAADGAMQPVPASEAAVQNLVRVEASQKGARLWRNNVGAGYSEDGQFMRWGLANDSAAVNRVLKSSDLVGIRPRVIQPGDVGSLIGQFLCREVKAGAWRYRGTDREVAQLAWIKLVQSLGGDAAFCTGVGSI